MKDMKIQFKATRLFYARPTRLFDSDTEGYVGDRISNLGFSTNKAPLISPRISCKNGPRSRMYCRKRLEDLQETISENYGRSLRDLLG